MRDIEVRTIKKRYIVRPKTAEQDALLRFIDARPTVEGVSDETIDLPLAEKHGFVSVDFPTGYRCEGTSMQLLSDLHIFHYNETVREFPSAALIHCASIKTDRGHVLIVGHKAAGKTTLMLRLATAGIRVAGDEHFILADEMSIPRPRTLRVKESSLKFLAGDRAGRIENCPHVADWFGNRIFSIAPDQFGQPWTLSSAPVTDVIIVRSNHGGRSSIRYKPSEDVLEPLLQNTLLPKAERLAAFVRLRHMCQSCNGWELSLGDLDGAENLIYRLLDDKI
ncbi:MAG: hypothetical protein AAFR27_02790 [Pseudomonadota bacterium]